MNDPINKHEVIEQIKAINQQKKLLIELLLDLENIGIQLSDKLGCL